MGIFSKLLETALFSHEYICNECGEQMEFEDENEDILVCPHCGNSMLLERYGFSSDEEYESLFESDEDDDDDDEGEYYEEEYNELDDD